MASEPQIATGTTIEVVTRLKSRIAALTATQEAAEAEAKRLREALLWHLRRDNSHKLRQEHHSARCPKTNPYERKDCLCGADLLGLTPEKNARAALAAAKKEGK